MNIKNDVISLDNGYKFLYQGAHYQFEYLTGKKKVSTESIENFNYNEKDNKTFCELNGIKYLSIVFPSRPVIKSELLKNYGFDIRSIFNDFSSSVLYPINILMESEDNILVTDTHYSATGSWKITKILLENLDTKFDFEPEFSTVQRVCDLDRMIGEPTSSVIPSFVGFKSKIDMPIVFNNRASLLSNTGNIKIAINPLASDERRILIFGDSFFADDIFKQLSYVFDEVIYIRNENVCKDTIKCINPDIVLNGTAERYLSTVRSNLKSPPFFTKFFCTSLLSSVVKDNEFSDAANAIFSGNSSLLYKKWKDNIISFYFSKLEHVNSVRSIFNYIESLYDNNSLSKSATEYAFKFLTKMDNKIGEQFLSYKNLNELGQSFYPLQSFDCKEYSLSVDCIFNSFADTYLHWLIKGRKSGAFYCKNVTSLLKIGLKCKDEPELLEYWIEYHASIVGYDNIIVFDTGSTDIKHLSILRKYAGKISIYNYEDHYNKLHNTIFNSKLYDYISLTCKYFTVLDCDEYLSCFVDGMLSKDKLIDLLYNSESKVLPGIWLHNTSKPIITNEGIDNLSFDLSEKMLTKGFIDGKAIIRSEYFSKIKHVGHNLHVKEVAEAISYDSIGKIFVLHLSKLGKNIVRSRIYKHLLTRGVFNDKKNETTYDYLASNINKFSGKERLYIQNYLNASDEFNEPVKYGTTNILNLKINNCLQEKLQLELLNLSFNKIYDNRLKYLMDR